ncbi:hypothetical protein [Tenacibaculum aiptasiae]|uniref:hypothetical protein n=1 Tax=Tenacibaculum aiptasiae TaxID=426481 RepID=UPI003B5CA799
MKYILSFVVVYFLTSIYLEDYNFDKVFIFSLEALLTSLFLTLLGFISFFRAPNEKKGIIIIKFLVSIVLVVIFYKITSTYFQKYIKLWSLIALPISFMIMNFIEYGKKNGLKAKEEHNS